MSGQGSSSQSVSQEYVVKAPPLNAGKIFSMLKFTNVDLKARNIQVKIERENNLKDYKLSYGIDQMPKFGAGSEYGREQKDEARRKKFGISRKTYNPRHQPMLLQLTDSKQTKKYRGTKEGGIMQNASYYIFKQCEDGAFQLMPIEEWYNFSPVINYKCLNSEEAEEEFDRRDRTLNFFTIMVNKRMKKDDDADADGDDGGPKGKRKPKKKKTKDFNLTDMDEWAILADDSDDSDDDGEGDESKKPKKEKKAKKAKKKNKANSDDEALEESDDLDEGQEVDYMTDSDSNDEDMYEKKDREEEEKYQEKGVEDEEGLRKLGASGDEDDDQEETKEEEDAEAAEEKVKDSDSESSSSSDSDSDPEKQPNFASALFMQSKQSSKQKKAGGDATSKEGTTVSSADAAETSLKGKKRKLEGENEPNKKEKLDFSASSSFSASEGITEDAVKRYLMRKPITIKDLIQKFKSKNSDMTKEKLVTSIAQIIRRLNPDKTKANDKLYLFIKKTE